MEKKYATVRKLIVIFFGPDYQIFGETIDEIMDSYKETENEIAFSNLRTQVFQLLAIDSDEELNTVMSALAENQFNPVPWGETWRSFLQKIVQQIPG